MVDITEAMIRHWRWTLFLTGLLFLSALPPLTEPLGNIGNLWVTTTAALILLPVTLFFNDIRQDVMTDRLEKNRYLGTPVNNRESRVFTVVTFLFGLFFLSFFIFSLYYIHNLLKPVYEFILQNSMPIFLVMVISTVYFFFQTNKKAAEEARMAKGRAEQRKKWEREMKEEQKERRRRVRRDKLGLSHRASDLDCRKKEEEIKFKQREENKRIYAENHAKRSQAAKKAAATRKRNAAKMMKAKAAEEARLAKLLAKKKAERAKKAEKAAATRKRNEAKKKAEELKERRLKRKLKSLKIAGLPNHIDITYLENDLSEKEYAELYKYLRKGGAKFDKDNKYDILDHVDKLVFRQIISKEDGLFLINHRGHIELMEQFRKETSSPKGMENAVKKVEIIRDLLVLKGFAEHPEAVKKVVDGADIEAVALLHDIKLNKVKHTIRKPQKEYAEKEIKQVSENNLANKAQPAPPSEEKVKIRKGRFS